MTSLGPSTRRYAHGAEVSGDGASFRVWAERAGSVGLVLSDGCEIALAPEAGGWFSGRSARVSSPGTRYAFRLDGGAPLADPASRAQVSGPDSWSVLVDPSAYRWKHSDWRGIPAHGQVIYEIHVGTFTKRGTWAAAADRLPHLAALGVTVVEMMPIADFRGRFGWGYDGALSYAPTGLYGTPDDLRAFVDAAHGHGIGVILDVVYNHFGPGNRFAEFSDRWFTDRYENEWGDSLNFDGEGCGPVRDYVAENAAYWIAEFNFDGLRLDATQALFDASAEHILARIAREARVAAGDRKILLIAENEPQETRLVRPELDDGYGLDALWNDDFHHSAHVALTGRREAYYHDYRGAPQEFVSAARYGYLFQGQRYDWQDAPRGTPGLSLPPTAFVTFLENHDQVANSARGLRLHALASHARLRALTALLLLSPQTPMLFQGQEFWASAPFHFFADQGPELDPKIAEGRVGVAGAVCQPAGPGGAIAAPGPRGVGNLRELSPGLVRSRRAWRRSRAPPRPPAAPSRDCGLRRAVARRHPGRRVGPRHPRRCFCGSSRTSPPTKGCCSSTSAATCPSRACRTRSSPRRPEPTGTWSGRARTRCMAEAAGAESKPPGVSH